VAIKSITPSSKARELRYHGAIAGGFICANEPIFHKHWYSVTNAVVSPQLLPNSVYLDAVNPLLHLLTYAGYVGDAGIS